MFKKLIFICCACGICLSSCTHPTQEERDNSFSNCVEKVNYQGHQYILYIGNMLYMGNSRGGICHDPDCPCDSIKE